MVVFRVGDTGVGMTPEQIERIFEAFAQADATVSRRFGGTGLGLTITRRFCQMLGGDVKVQSKPGKGSVFTAWMRASVDRTARQADSPGHQQLPARVADAAAGTSPDLPTVLAIDDDPVALDLIGRPLGKAGFRVVGALGGEEGLRLARKLRPVAITLDLLMAGMDGWTVLGRLKGDPALADIPVVILTILDARQKAFALGASEFLPKPIDRARLAAILDKYRADGAARSVLLVDDDASARAVLRRVLVREGWTILEAENGRVALERIEERPPGLILLDLMMPEMDGFEFVEALRARPEWQAIPVLVLTAKDVDAADRERLDGWVTSVVRKGANDVNASLRQACDLVLAATRASRGAE